ncbi:MAG: DNA recombination/repair protein RecA, partial [Candidatus Electrothrix sp. MAN1_4]|nr:DNA recombination/repair protein RecA [Candidatus Electrothrix sp. MAN1_4]
NAKTFLKEHPDMLMEIDRKVRLGFGLPVAGEPPVPAAAEEEAGQEDKDNKENKKATK